MSTELFFELGTASIYASYQIATYHHYLEDRLSTHLNDICDQRDIHISNKEALSQALIDSYAKTISECNIVIRSPFSKVPITKILCYIPAVIARKKMEKNYKTLKQHQALEQLYKHIMK